MITYQPYPTDLISIVPPRDAPADPRTSLDRLRARFAQRGPPVRRRPDRGQDPRRPRRARHPLPRPGVQPGHDPLGLPLPGPQRRPELPRRRDAHHRPPRRQRPGDLLAQHGQLLQRPGPAPHRRLVHPGEADGPGTAGRDRGGVEVERAERLHRRRIARLDARHAGEPGGLPPAPDPTAGAGLPPGPGRRAAVAGDRRLPRPGHRAVRGQGDR